MTDLFTSAGDRVEFVDISGLLPKMQEINPVYAEGTVPAAAYSTPADVHDDRGAQPPAGAQRTSPPATRARSPG